MQQAQDQAVIDAQRANQLTAQAAPLAQYQALSPFIQMVPQGSFQTSTQFMPRPSPMMAGINVGLFSPARQYGWLSIFFHQYLAGTFINDPNQTAYFAGVFAGYMVVAPMSVALGEVRHMSNCVTNMRSIDYATFAAAYPLMYKQYGETVVAPTDRKAAYKAIEDYPITLDSSILMLEWLTQMYFGRNWKSVSVASRTVNQFAKHLMSLLM